MATITKGKTFISGETVEPADMHQLVDQATIAFVSADDTDNSTLEASGGKLRIKDAGVTAAKLASTLDLSTKTLTLPDDSVTNDKLSLAANDGEIKKALNADNSPPIFACRAWVNFNGSAGSTVDGEFRCTIGASGNVIKVVRINTGVYEVNFADALPDANYAVVATGRRSTGAPVPAGIVAHSQVTDPTTSKVRVVTTDTAGTLENMPMVSVAIFR
jgi:hypothetical protein